MKNRRSLSKIAALIMAVILLIGSVPLTGVSAAERAYTEKEIDAYLFSMEDTAKLKCLMYDDMPSMPYVSITDYLGKIVEKEFSIAESGKGVYTVKSPTEKTMVIDTGKDTVHFDNFEDFFPKAAADADNDGPEAAYIKDFEIVVEGKQNALDLEFGKYQIDITAVNGAVYLPLTTLSDLFADTALTAVYLSDKIFFMQGNKAYFDEEIFRSTPRSADLIEYSYRELCFVFDYLFGYPPKSELGAKIKENNGFDGLISNTEFGKTVKPLLMSESVTDYYIGLILIDNMLDDGGHSTLSVGYTKALLAEVPGSFVENVNAIMENANDPNAVVIAQNIKSFTEHGESFEQLSKLRTQSYSQYELVKTWEDENEPDESESFIAQLVMADDTAIFLFNEFKDEVVPAFKWSLDYAKEKDAKNFVVDLSMNGGGSSGVLVYMMSVMTGKSEFYVKNTINGNIVRQKSVIDKNLDNVIDEKDNEVSYDFRFAVLTTRKSFSCANYLPCLLQQAQIPVIGETSGGGTCFIMEMSLPCAVPYSLSGFKMMVDEKGNDVEKGAKPDYETVTVDADGNADYAKLYDIAAIRTFLDEYYTKVTPTKAASTVAATSHAGGSSIGKILLIVIPFALVAVVITVVFMVIGKRRRKSVDTADK